MGLFDFLINTGNNIKEGAGNVLNKIRYANAPQIQPLQVAENGGLDAQRTLELALAQPKSLRERLGGRTVSIDTETRNPKTNEMELSRISKYQPGLLDDIRAGARENFATGFAAPNWEQTKTPDGRNKGLGYRFGEGVGSLAKFAETPLGRGLIMAGIVGAAGGSGLEALGYGTGTGLLNQQSRMKDSIYRNSLIEQGQNSLRNQAGFNELKPEEQQAQLDRIANQVNSYRGYLGDDTYKQVLAGMQLRDNAEYRNALLAGQRKDQEMAIQQRQAELQQKTLSDAADRALKNRELDIKEYQALNEGKEAQNKGDMVFSQLQLLEDAFNNMPQSKAKIGQKGKAILTGATNLVGLRNDDVTAYEAIRNPLVTTLARSIAGEKGVLTDKDFARAEKMVPTSFDSPEQAQAKFEQIRKLVGVSLGGSTPQAQTTQNISINNNALEAEMKRRGLK